MQGRFESCCARRRLLAGNGSLQLRASGQLDRVASRNLDGFAGLRVAAGASCTVGALNCEPARDRDLLALGNLGNEYVEHCIQNTVDGYLGVAGLLGNSCNKFTTVHSQSMSSWTSSSRPVSARAASRSRGLLCENLPNLAGRNARIGPNSRDFFEVWQVFRLQRSVLPPKRDEQHALGLWPPPPDRARFSSPAALSGAPLTLASRRCWRTGPRKERWFRWPFPPLPKCTSRRRDPS